MLVVCSVSPSIWDYLAPEPSMLLETVSSYVFYCRQNFSNVKLDCCFFHTVHMAVLFSKCVHIVHIFHFQAIVCLFVILLKLLVSNFELICGSCHGLLGLSRPSELMWFVDML